MLNPPISEQVTQVLHSFWALFGCDIRGTACISWTQNPALRPPHPLDSSSSSAPRDCWWRPWRFHAPSLERTKSLIIAVISWWWDDDSWWWYWWFYDNLIFYQPISLMFTVDASSWASLQKLWRDQYHMCWKYEYLKQPAMVDRSESSYNIYILQPDWWKWAKKVASWVMPTEKSTAINDHQGAPSWARKDTLWFLQKWLKFGIPRIHLKSGSWT